MLHSTSKDGSSVCDARCLQTIDLQGLTPHSLFLNHDRLFQAFEFEYGAHETSNTLTSSFLKALRDLFLYLDLQSTACLVRTSESTLPGSILVETVLPDACRTQSELQEICRSRRHHQAAVITTWFFDRDKDGKLHVLEVKQCVKDNARIHNVT